MTSPFEQIESLCIGTIEFVSPDEIKVSLNIEAPESIALNSGNPMAFPKINNYLLIPNDEGYLVGQIVWLAIERVPYPKRKGTQKDFGLVDLPYPARKMSLNPVGILKETINSKNGNRKKEFKFKRGVNAFPSVGDNVLLPIQKQLHAIIASGDDTSISIGVSPLADGAEVQVNPDRLFGRHLAVLGNTGSGKSCSIAGLIRWSLEAANKEIEKVKKTKEGEAPNARFIILDPNGEYSRAFNPDKNDNSKIKAQVFQVDPDDGNKKLRVPLWFLNSAEWIAFTQASGGTQKPLLQEALRGVRADSIKEKSGDTVNQDDISDDRPIRFKGTDLVDRLQTLSEEKGIGKYVGTLIMRLQAMLDDTRIQSIMSNDSGEMTLVDWLNDYLGKDEDRENNITIIDLSLVPSEVVHIIIAIAARVTFEALQRYRKLKNEILPTIIVVEEAHTFVKRYKDDVENLNAAAICCGVFEKIAREGRKFGLGLVISSQRPSELSSTVLSQCNTFLLHRISNDKDQELVKRFIPENLKGLLRELPVLPSQQAILMGWASRLPLLVKMNNLPKEHQPQSDDPDFWDVWTGKSERKIDWEKVANDWQGDAEADNTNSRKANTN